MPRPSLAADVRARLAAQATQRLPGNLRARIAEMSHREQIIRRERTRSRFVDDGAYFDHLVSRALTDGRRQSDTTERR